MKHHFKVKYNGIIVLNSKRGDFEGYDSHEAAEQGAKDSVKGAKLPLDQCTITTHVELIEELV